MDVQEYVGEDGNLVQDGQELIILLGSGTKKSQQSDIAKAQRLCQEYKRRKKSD